MPFPSLLLGGKLVVLQHKPTSTREWNKNTPRSKRVSVLEAVVVSIQDSSSPRQQRAPQRRQSKLTESAQTWQHFSTKLLTALKHCRPSFRASFLLLFRSEDGAVSHHGITARQEWLDRREHHVPVALPNGTPHLSRKTLPASLCVLYSLNIKLYGGVLE